MNVWKKVELLEHEAAEFGLQWETTTQILEQIQSECREISEHLQPTLGKDSASAQEEIGDLMHAVFSLCIYCQFSPKETFQKTLKKFERRLHAVKLIAQEKNCSNLHGHSYKELMAIWNLAKKRVG